MKTRNAQDIVNMCVELQRNVNNIMDSSGSTAQTEGGGIRQVLEKKEGLFRQNMMVSFLLLFFANLTRTYLAFLFPSLPLSRGKFDFLPLLIFLLGCLNCIFLGKTCQLRCSFGHFTGSEP